MNEWSKFLRIQIFLGLQQEIYPALGPIHFTCAITKDATSILSDVKIARISGPNP
jgi:hypothetical protein